MNTIQRLRERQEDLRLIWEHAITNAPNRQHMVLNYVTEDGQETLMEHAVLRRGFKITLNNKMGGMYELLAIHSTDFYKYASDKEIDFFLKRGFIRACDELQIERHQKKIDRYNVKIDQANSERNDSVMTHWRKRRLELINDKSLIEENLHNWEVTPLK